MTPPARLPTVGSPSTMRMSVRGLMMTGPPGHRAHHLEVDGLGERGHADRRSGDHRHTDEIFEQPLVRDDGGGRSHPQRCQPDGHRLRSFDDRRGNRLLEAGAAVAAQRAVDLDDAVGSGLGDFRARDRGCPARDLQDVAGTSADAREIRGRQARDRVCDVADPRFRDPQREGGDGGRGRGGGGRVGHRGLGRSCGCVR
jgi:hypothetical protein